MRDTSEKVKKCINFTWEGRTSKSPRSNEITPFFKSEQCTMHLKGFFHRNQLSGPVKMKGFWQKQVCPKRYTLKKVKKK